MIEVKLTFPDQAALLAFFSGTQTVAAPEAPAPRPKEEPKVSPKPAPTQPTATEAQPPAAAPEVVTDYKVLQAAVFKLAQKSRAAAAEVCTTLFGLGKTFKDSPPDRWTEALAAVNKKLAELEAA